MSSIICGVDPGLGITGYAVLRVDGSTVEIADAGVCRFDRTGSMTQRLLDIERDLTAIFEEHSPDCVAVEQLYAHYKHPRTAILMGHARGAMLLTAGRLGIEVRSYAATRVKRYLTGNGRASKAQVQKSVKATLGLTVLPEPADVADAIAIALCCAADIAHPYVPESAE